MKNVLKHSVNCWEVLLGNAKDNQQPSPKGKVQRLSEASEYSQAAGSAEQPEKVEDIVSSIRKLVAAVKGGRRSRDLLRRKMITTMSKEIAERSTPAIEGILRNALSEAYSTVLDNALLSNAAAIAGVRPAGITNGLTGAATGAGAAAGATAGSAVRADLQAMLAHFQANRVGSRPVLIMNDQTRLALSMSVSSLGDYIFRDEIATGSLMGMEVISSANVTAGTVLMVDADSFVAAFDMPMFDVSEIATVTEPNADATAPTHAATAAAADKGKVAPAITGGIAVGETGAGASAGYTSRSLWQSWSLGIRMVAPTSWAFTRDGAVAVRTSVNW